MQHHTLFWGINLQVIAVLLYYTLHENIVGAEHIILQIKLHLLLPLYLLTKLILPVSVGPPNTAYPITV